MSPQAVETPFDVVVFDCDSTLSWVEGIEELYGGPAADPEVERNVAALTAAAMAGEIPLEEAYGRRLELIQPTQAAVAAIGSRYVETLMEGAEEVVLALRLLGKEVAILSGGLAPPVRALGRFLGVPDSLIFAVGIDFDAQGDYAGFDVQSPLARAGGKPEVIEAQFGERRTVLVGDGATDLEARRACERFVAFAGAVERPKVVAAADRAVLAPDLALVLPHVLTEEELGRLAALGSDRLRSLAARARRPRLWIPGPTEVRGEILRRQAVPMQGHRTDSARRLIASLDPLLRSAFGLRGVSELRGAEGHAVAVHSCTATGLMEMSLRALGGAEGVQKADSPRVLSLVNGAFSARYAEIAEAVGCEVTRIESPLGQPADLNAAEAALERARKAGMDFDAVTVCLSETSTGALTEPSEIASALARRGQAALLVDAVTYLGAAPVDAARHGFDFVFAGTQKALALPPGLGVYAVSRRFLDRGRSSQRRGFFLDLVRVTEAHAAQNPPMTPTLSLLEAMALQLETIEGGEWEARLLGSSLDGAAGGGGSGQRSGWELRFLRHSLMRSISTEWLAELNQQHFGEGRPGVGRHGVRRSGVKRLGGAQHVRSSPSVTCLDIGACLDTGAGAQRGSRSVADVCASMREAGFEIAAGYGPLRDSCVRIGHMGDHSVTEFRALLRALSCILREA